MCKVLYLAADEPQPVLPDGGTPPAPLSVRSLQQREEPVRERFSKPHVYFVGAYTGCSCGFSYGPYSDDDAEGRESTRQLAAYLTAAVARSGPVEVYSCWDGEEAEPAAERAAVTPAAFASDAAEFNLPDRWFAVVSAPAS